MPNDAHCHFFSAGFFEALGAMAGTRFGSDRSTTVPAALGWDAPGSAAELAIRWRDELRAHGVSRAAVIASVPGDEQSVIDAVASAPDTFVGYFMLNPLPDDAPDRVTAALTDGRLRVVCLMPAMQRYSLLDERVARVIERVAAVKGAAVFAHCGVLSVGAAKRLGLATRFEARFGQPLDVQALAAAWPTVPFIIPHFGGGFLREALMAADMCANVYLDTSSSNGWIRYHPGLTLSDVFKQAMSVAGPERLLFGTDSSFFPRGWNRPVFDAQSAILDGLHTSAADRDLILGGNFDRLFPVG